MPRPSRTSTPRLPFEEPAAPAGADLPDAADRAAAVDPTRNVVLEASAGTGKTRVLVDRYVEPAEGAASIRANILAITFTRKAAAEMRERILHEAAERRCHRRDSTRLAGATCATGWVTSRSARSMRSVCRCSASSRSKPTSTPASRWPTRPRCCASSTRRWIARCASCRGIARHRSGGGAALRAARRAEAAGRPGRAARPAARRARRPAAVPRPRPWRCEPRGGLRPGGRTARATRCGRSRGGWPPSSRTDRAFIPASPCWPATSRRLHRQVAALRREGGELASRMRLIADGLRDHFLNDKGEPRTRWSYKASDADTPEAWKRHRDRAKRVAPAIADDLARFSRDLNVVLSHAVWRVFEIALSEYRRTLAAHAVVDFPDALWRTLELLAQMDEFAQSRYLLQARYHHLLVDEFQDTSQAQWELVWRLVQAWGEGVGMEQDAPLPPSIFIVGDRKQSIYGFRDADVGVLARAVVSIAGLRQDGSVRRAIRKSFRAVPALLAFTNDLFDAVEKQERPDAFAYGESDRFPVDAAVARRRARPGPRGCAGCRLVCRARSERDRQAADLGAGARQGDRSRARRAAGRHRHPLPLARGAPGVRVCARGAWYRLLRLQRARASSTPTRSKTSSRCCGILRSRTRICARRRSCGRGSCGCPMRLSSSLHPAGRRTSRCHAAGRGARDRGPGSARARTRCLCRLAAAGRLHAARGAPRPDPRRLRLRLRNGGPRAQGRRART